MRTALLKSVLEESQALTGGSNMAGLGTSDKNRASGAVGKTTCPVQETMRREKRDRQ